MDFLPAFMEAAKTSIAPIPTTTISVNPPGGTSMPSHAPLPGGPHEWPHARPQFVHAGHSGHTALWVVFGLFVAGFIGVGLMALRVEKKARIFHWLSAMILGTAMLSYYAMANTQGVTYVSNRYNGDTPELVHVFREIYWARYVDWLITTPLLLVSLAFLAGLSPADTLLAIVADIGMIVTGLFSALTPARWARGEPTSGGWIGGERAKWGWFAISCVAFLVIWFVLFTGGMKAAASRPRKTRGLFTLLAVMTAVLWTAYPIVFGLSEGANRISVNAEIISYGVLDVAAKLGFTFMLLLIHTHGEDDTFILPDWFVSPRVGLGQDGRGGYGAVRSGDDD